MSNKKEWFSPNMRPNAGISVTLLVENLETGKSMMRKGTWNRTHWVFVRSDKKIQIPRNMMVIGWRT